MVIMTVGASCVVSDKESTCQRRRQGLDPWVRKIPLEKEMAAHSSILAWRTPAWWVTVHGVIEELDVTLASKQEQHHDNRVLDLVPPVL